MFVDKGGMGCMGCGMPVQIQFPDGGLYLCLLQ